MARYGRSRSVKGGGTENAGLENDGPNREVVYCACNCIAGTVTQLELGLYGDITICKRCVIFNELFWRF